MKTKLIASLLVFSSVSFSQTKQDIFETLQTILETPWPDENMRISKNCYNDDIKTYTSHFPNQGDLVLLTSLFIKNVPLCYTASYNKNKKLYLIELYGTAYKKVGKFFLWEKGNMFMFYDEDKFQLTIGKNYVVIRDNNSSPDATVLDN